LKDEKEKRKLITQNGFEIIKMVIKRMRVKIKIKNKLEGNYKFLIRRLN